MYKYLITINPVGMMYGSSGGFLSPENLVGRSRAKFPPDAAALAGLIFSRDRAKAESLPKAEADERHKHLRDSLWVAGPFWAEIDSPYDFYVPIPRTKIISAEGWIEWHFQEGNWGQDKSRDREIEPEYQWVRLTAWQDDCALIQDNEAAAKTPWEFVPMLHPQMKADERHTIEEGGLFLEYAVQMSDEHCLVYLSTISLESGWYRFGGENHFVEINTIDLERENLTWILEPFQQPIQRSFALITPGVWGSNRFSYRYPQHPNFPQTGLKMLTDKPVPFRYRAGKRLGRGRYAVPPGSVYLLDSPLNLTWWDWSNSWFPKEGFHLNRLGCGLCLPLTIQGVN